MQRRHFISALPCMGIALTAHAQQLACSVDASFGDVFSDLQTFQIGEKYYISPTWSNKEILESYRASNSESGMVVHNNTPPGYMSIRHEPDNQQCVTLVRALSNAGHSSGWRVGMDVIDLTHKVYYPVPIATFNNNGVYSPGHAALLLYVSELGITVLDQNWDNKNGRIAVHLIPFLENGGNSVGNAYNYSVIERNFWPLPHLFHGNHDWEKPHLEGWGFLYYTEINKKTVIAYPQEAVSVYQSSQFIQYASPQETFFFIHEYWVNGLPMHNFHYFPKNGIISRIVIL